MGQLVDGVWHDIWYDTPAFGPAYEALLFLCVFLASLACVVYVAMKLTYWNLPKCKMRLDSGSAASITYFFKFLGTKDCSGKEAVCALCSTVAS